MGFEGGNWDRPRLDKGWVWGQTLRDCSCRYEFGGVGSNKSRDKVCSISRRKSNHKFGEINESVE